MRAKKLASEIYWPVKKQKNTEPINILLLGETGVGKSTWINGVANYLSFKDIDETIEKGLKVVIPDNFTTIDNEGNVQIVKFEPKGDIQCVSYWYFSSKIVCFDYLYLYDSIITENDCLLNSAEICFFFEVLLQLFQTLNKSEVNS
jgi:GTPase SAR1 family protein